MSHFSAEEWQRYQRHIQLPSLGVNGQLCLKQAHVVIVGIGGLGCPVVQYLGAAGVGRITLVDGDTISRSNLHRQVLFGEADIGQYKAHVAASRVRSNNSSITVDAITQNLQPENALPLIEKADLVLDCSDNFAVRYLINDICVNTATPWLFASVVQMSGQAALFVPGKACFRCLFPEPPEGVADCNSAGVLGTLPGIVGLLQANEGIKLLTGQECPLQSHLMLIEGLDLQFRPIRLKQSASCPCGSGNIDLAAMANDYIVACSNSAATAASLDSEKFAEARDSTGIILIDVRSALEYEGFNLGGINLPLSEDFVRAVEAEAIDRETPCLLYCQSGKRSEKAAEQLRIAGYRNVKHLAGGISSWLETGG